MAAEAASLDELLDGLKAEIARAIDDRDFEDDLDYVVTKNAELYRRLAQ